MISIWILNKIHHPQHGLLEHINVLRIALLRALNTAAGSAHCYPLQKAPPAAAALKPVIETPRVTRAATAVRAAKTVLSTVKRFSASLGGIAGAPKTLRVLKNLRPYQTLSLDSTFIGKDFNRGLYQNSSREMRKKII